MQSVLPLMTASLEHHGETAMHCDLSSGCSSCPIDGDMDSDMECSCDHSATTEDGKTVVKLCGCSHHNSTAMAITITSQFKAIFIKVNSPFQRSQKSVELLKIKTAFPIIAQDIFHPPRLAA